MSTLSARQQSELQLALLDYLAASGFQETFESLKREAGQVDYVHDPKAKTANLLEKKWTSVIRLQKKVMDLESTNAQLLEELANVRANPAQASSRSSADWLPRNPPKHSLTGHRAPITRVSFHPVFSVLVTASEDATLKVWDWETGDFERTLKGHTKGVQDCDYDSKGNLLVSCSMDLTIKVWSAADEYKNTKTLFGHDHSVSSVKFMPGDDHIVSASRDKTIRIWEVANGFCVKTFSGHAEWVRSAIPSRDGRWVASCASDQSARLWDASTGETKLDLRGHDNVVEAVAFAPSSACAAIRELSGIAPAKDKSNPSHAFLATGSRDKTIKLWDGQTGQCLRTLTGHDNWIRALVFHPSGKFLLSASDDKTVRIWDLATGRCSKTIDAHSHFVTCMAWGRAPLAKSINGASTNGDSVATEGRQVNVLATGSVDQTVNIWLP